MTEVLWFLLAGIILSFILAIIFTLAKIPSLATTALIVCVLCIVCFAADISINPIKNPDLVSESAEQVNLEEMIHEYKANEIRAKEKYFENRYQLSGTIVSIERAGAREGFVGYNVTVETVVDGKRFELCANFQGDMKNIIMELNVGDTLTFTGKCIAPELWYNCTVVEK